MKLKAIFWIIGFLCLSIGISAQIPTGLKSKVNTHPELFTINVSQLTDKLIAEDIESIKNGAPMRVAKGTLKQINIIDEGTKYKGLTSDNSTVFQYDINVEGGYGLILSFESLYIPPDDTLFIYNNDGSIIYWYDHEKIPDAKNFATPIINSSQVRVEYVQADGQTENAFLKVANIAYLYQTYEELGCFINVGCAEGDNWQQQKEGVVGLLVNLFENWYVCSASLINNVRYDATPYVLSAHHCFEGADDNTFATIKIDFFKESTSSICTDNSTYSSLTKTLTGAKLLVDIPLNDATDGTLLQITDTIPDDWEVYYNGWDARDIMPDSGVSIHHPNGIVKKISTYNHALGSTSNVSFGSGDSGENSHWVVVWNETENGYSVTYGGSSGSPLFNQNGLIIGTLSGGGSFCDTPTAPDYYGKFSSHWVESESFEKSFQTYLDPDNTGVLFVEGYSPHAYTFTSVPKALAATNVTPFSFTANWEKLNDTIDSYRLSVYTKDSIGNMKFVQDLKDKNVGNILSFSVENLEYETKYFYSVRAEVKFNLSEKSNEMLIETPQATFDHYAPFAKEATNVGARGFTANWEPMNNALSYTINVYENNETIFYIDSVDFSSNVVSENWFSESSAFVSTQNQFGNKAPSLRLNSNTYLVSPLIDSSNVVIKNIRFWYRGILTDIYSKIYIQYHSGNDWITLDSINSIVAKTGGEHISFNIDSTLQVKQIRIGFVTESGYLVVDDVAVSCGNIAKSKLIYENVEAGNTQSYSVSGLNPLSFYSYKIQGYNGTLYSLQSNTIKLKTQEGSSKVSITEDEFKVFVDKNYINIISETPKKRQKVFIYDLYGSLLINSEMTGNRYSISKNNFSTGLYIVKVGLCSYKVLLK